MRSPPSKRKWLRSIVTTITKKLQTTDVFNQPWGIQFLMFEFHCGFRWKYSKNVWETDHDADTLKKARPHVATYVWKLTYRVRNFHEQRRICIDNSKINLGIIAANHYTTWFPIFIHCIIPRRVSQAGCRGMGGIMCGSMSDTAISDTPLDRYLLNSVNIGSLNYVWNLAVGRSHETSQY